MKKPYLGQILTLVANLGVIAGILLLVVEIRQNNDLMVEEAQRARSEATREAFQTLAENGELAAILVKDAQGEALDATEAFRADGWWMRNFVGIQTSFQQLPRSEVEPMTDILRRYSETTPSFRAAWEANRNSFQRDFIEFMEQTVFNR